MTDALLPDTEMRAAVAALSAADSLLLCSHVRPDGDGIGSQAALARVLAGLGKRVAILNPDPPAARFDFFTEGLEFGVYRGGALPPHDLAVLLDISELSRCGELGERLEAAPSRKLVVDHHVHTGEAWWDHAFVDVGASATGLLVYRIAKLLGVELDVPAATAVFTSIASDTGWFKYSNTDAETLEAAADLVRAGVRPVEVYAALHQREVPEQPLWVAELLASVQYHADGRLAVVCLPRERSEIADEVDSDLVMDILRAVEVVEVVLFLRELADGTCKASLRSKTELDVNAVARRFGGGGHRKASGATVPGPLDDALRRLVEAVLEDLVAAGGGAA